MREMESTITQKGQITIPAEIRRALGIKKGDRAAFVIEGDRVWLIFKGSVVERNFGIVKSTEPPLTAQEEREAFEQGVAEEDDAEDQMTKEALRKSAGALAGVDRRALLADIHGARGQASRRRRA